jgi:predicted esterase YcpF (UPF0227 family)
LPVIRRPRWWVIVLLMISVFAAGCAFGGLGALLVLRHAIHETLVHPETAPPRIAGWLHRKLSLSETQTQQVEQILQSRQKALVDIRRDMHPRVEKELDLLQREVDAVLDAQQQQRWHDLLSRLRSQWLPPP